MSWIIASIVYIAFFVGAFVRPRLLWLSSWALICIFPLWRLNSSTATGNFSAELIFAGAVYGFFLGILVQIYRLGISWKTTNTLERWPFVLGLVGPIQILVDFV